MVTLKTDAQIPAGSDHILFFHQHILQVLTFQFIKSTYCHIDFNVAISMGWSVMQDLLQILLMLAASPPFPSPHPASIGDIWCPQLYASYPNSPTVAQKLSSLMLCTPPGLWRGSVY